MGAILSAPVDSIVLERAGSKDLRCAVATLQGWRCSHEDAHIMLQPSNSTGKDPIPYLFSVLDGHGGDEAAKAMHTVFPAGIDVTTLPAVSSGSLPDVIIDRFKSVDKELRSIIPESCSAGTTCTSALVHRNNETDWDITLMNAGDSRSVLIRVSEDSFAATDDHKPDNPEETARIKAAGGFVSSDVGGPSRVDNNLAVSRAFGDFEYKDINRPAEEQKISCVPDVTQLKAKTGDILFLACDGIFDVMTNEEVVAYINAADMKDVGDVCGNLLLHVLEKGSKDNCSAMIVCLGDVEKHKDDDQIPNSTIVPPEKWDGWHTGYWTEQLIVGNRVEQEDSVKEKFRNFHTTFGFPEPLPEPCGNCGRIFLGMQVCSRCKEDIYCSHYCQKRDWKAQHKEGEPEEWKLSPDLWDDLYIPAFNPTFDFSSPKYSDNGWIHTGSFNTYPVNGLEDEDSDDSLQPVTFSR